MKKLDFLKRLGYYLAGFVILTLGQRLFVEASLGAGSLDALCVGLAGRTGLTAGTWVAITAVIMIAASALLLKRKPRLTALVSSYVFGIFFDLWGRFFSRYFTEDSLKLHIIMYLAGIILAPLGTAIYFKSGFSKTALDEFIMSVRESRNLSVRAAKTIVEVANCLLAVAAGGPIGVATVLTAFLFGPILQFFLGPVYKKGDPVLSEK